MLLPGLLLSPHPGYPPTTPHKEPPLPQRSHRGVDLFLFTHRRCGGAAGGLQVRSLHRARSCVRLRFAAFGQTHPDYGDAVIVGFHGGLKIPAGLWGTSQHRVFSASLSPNAQRGHSDAPGVGEWHCFMRGGWGGENQTTNAKGRGPPWPH